MVMAAFYVQPCGEEVSDPELGERQDLVKGEGRPGRDYETGV